MSDAPQAFQAFNTWSDELKQEGLSEDTIATMMGAATRTVLDRLLEQVSAWLGEQAAEELSTMTPEEQEAKIAAVVQENTGKTIGELREEIAGQLVEEYRQQPAALA